jgi:hypothetical protein
MPLHEAITLAHYALLGYTGLQLQEPWRTIQAGRCAEVKDGSYTARLTLAPDAHTLVAIALYNGEEVQRWEIPTRGLK